MAMTRWLTLPLVTACTPEPPSGSAPLPGTEWSLAADLVASFDGSGVSIEAACRPEPVLGLALRAWGRSGHMVDDRSGLDEWWRRTPGGLQQGWNVDIEPPGTGPITFEVGIDHGRQVVASRSLAITDACGELWSIGGIAAWDATGRDLAATGHLEAGALVVTVEDAGAVYPIVVDPVYTTPGWMFLSGTGSIGRANGIADVNGDGFDDVAVGAPGAGSGGAVYLHNGSAGGLEADASWVVYGEVGEGLGWTAVGAGDVNGDGYEDVLVGAEHWSESLGRVHVFHGSASGLSSPSATVISGTTPTAQFGYIVAGIGDTNNDGYDDIAVADEEATVYVFEGSSSGVSSTPATTLAGDKGSVFGEAVAGGDVDGDGFSDLIVGDYTFDGYNGVAYVYAGSATGLSSKPTTTLYGEDDGFGDEIASGGDVNNDGYDDVVITGTDVYLFLGTSGGLSTSAETTYEGDLGFGHRVSILGDINGDGDDDIAFIAATTDEVHLATDWESDSHGPAVGFSADDFIEQALGADVNGDGLVDLLVGMYDPLEVRVFHSDGTDIEEKATTTVTEFLPDTYFPVPAAAGDLNGDGYADIAIGAAPLEDGSESVQIQFGGKGGPGELADVSIDPPAGSTGQFGWSILLAGDTNADGYDDLVVSDRYQCFLYLGGTKGPDTTPAVTIDPAGGGASFGEGLAALGDVDGDGHDDIAISGVSYIAEYRGNASGLATVPTDIIYAVEDGRDLAAGDFDDDGTVDVALGGAYTDSQTGSVEVFYGFTPKGGVTLRGEGPSNSFGEVVDAGDINGDGIDDLVVGAPDWGEQIGRIYVFHGQKGGLPTKPTTVLTGAKAPEELGSVFAVLGDVNGDGYDDIATGYYDADGAAEDGGRVVVYEGSAKGLNVTGPTVIEGPVLDWHLGESVAAAGDVNGDGADDLLAGTWTEIWLYYGIAGDTDGDGTNDSEDCAPKDKTIHPGAHETCDGVDEDCDGKIDEDAIDAPTWYPDADVDGYGKPDGSVTDCQKPSGYVDNSDDCDDANNTIYPGAPEIPGDGIDQDCDGSDLTEDTGPVDDTGTGPGDDTGSDPDNAEDDAGCKGCASTSSSAWSWLLALSGIAVVRRRNSIVRTGSR